MSASVVPRTTPWNAPAARRRRSSSVSGLAGARAGCGLVTVGDAGDGDLHPVQGAGVDDLGDGGLAGRQHLADRLAGLQDQLDRGQVAGAGHVGDRGTGRDRPVGRARRAAGEPDRDHRLVGRQPVDPDQRDHRVQRVALGGGQERRPVHPLQLLVGQGQLDADRLEQSAGHRADVEVGERDRSGLDRVVVDHQGRTGDRTAALRPERDPVEGRGVATARDQLEVGPGEDVRDLPGARPAPTATTPSRCDTRRTGRWASRARGREPSPGGTVRLSRTVPPVSVVSRSRTMSGYSRGSKVSCGAAGHQIPTARFRPTGSVPSTGRTSNDRLNEELVSASGSNRTATAVASTRGSAATASST